MHIYGRKGWCRLGVPVLDPRCELSASRLLLSPACMGGCALARVTLRGCNLSSGAAAAANCRPSVGNSSAWSRAAFSVQCSRRDVTVSPERGSLAPGQEVQLYVAFRPRLRSRDVRREADLIEQRRQDELRAQEELLGAAKGKKKGGSSSGRSQTQSPKSGKRGAAPVPPPGPTPEDLLEAEATLLRAFRTGIQQRVLSFRVTTTDSRTGEDRRERLRLELWCPVQQPAFQLLSGRQLDFGPTAAGTCRRLVLRMRALEAPASVRLSAPSPDSPFWVPHCALQQVEMPSEGDLSLPVCYRPSCEGGDDATDEQDCVEVRAGDGCTAARVQLRGRRVAPRLLLAPKGVGVWRTQAALGSGVDCAKIDVRNDCEAELSLELVLDAVLSAPDVPSSPPDADAPVSDVDSKSPRSSKGDKKSTKGTSKGKGKGKEQKQSPDLLEEERLELETAYQPVHPLVADHLFAITPVPAAFVLKPGGKASFKVRFTAPPPPGRAASEASTKDKKRKEKDKGKKKDSPGPTEVSPSTLALTQELLAQQVEQKLKYVARCFLMVGGVVRTHQLWFFARLKEGGAKEKKKKK